MEIVRLKPVAKFMDELDQKLQVRLARYLCLLSETNYNLREPFSKKLRGNLYELRLLGSVQVRIFYTFYNAQIYLLHGLVKKSRQIPKRDLKLAQSRLDELTRI